MKKISSYLLALLTVTVCGLLSSCSDYEPKGYPEVPAVAAASGLQASVAGRTVTLTWQLPSQGRHNRSACELRQRSPDPPSRRRHHLAPSRGSLWTASLSTP